MDVLETLWMASIVKQGVCLMVRQPSLEIETENIMLISGRVPVQNLDRRPGSFFQKFAALDPAPWNDSPPALRSMMLQGISSASLRSLKTFIYTSLSR